MRVALLAGGRSSEHEVSLASGASVAAALRGAGHEVVDVMLERDGAWSAGGEPLALSPGGGLLGVDVAFPVLHGPYGEDGTVQGLLELLDVPYVGSGVLASALCMDKILTKDVMAHAGLPQVAYWSLDVEARIELGAGIAMPCWVKPARLGSSVGISRVEQIDDLEAAIAAAAEHDPRVIVEADAPGVEVECALLGPADAPVASEPGQIVIGAGAGAGAGGWYDYDTKYTPGATELVAPAPISVAARRRVMELAVTAFRIAGCSGLARADFFVDGDAVLLNELNTMPGQTPTSAYARLWKASGHSYDDVVDRLVRIAIERHERARAFRG